MTSSALTRRILLIMVGAAVFGAAMSVLKGNDAGYRDEIGNLSAPWVLLPFLAGATVWGRLAIGAAVGTLATLCALSAFYVTNAFVLDLGPHSLAHDLALSVGATAYWFPRGLISGPLFGLLGALWTRSRYAIIGVAIFLVFDAEPVFWAVTQRTGGLQFAFSPSRSVSIGEGLLGLAACACAALVASRAHQHRA